MKYPHYPSEPNPLGVAKSNRGYNFALFSRHATTINLLIYDERKIILDDINLKADSNKTGDVWHINLELPPEAIYYAYQINGSSIEGSSNKGPIILDPYAKEVGSGNIWGKREGLNDMSYPLYQPLGTLPLWDVFDWQGVSSPGLAKQDLVIYETHVRGFTIHPSSSTQHPGTFFGVIEKIPYLVELGINALEFLPLQEFDENETLHFPSQTLHALHNYWGYSTVNFFSPMHRYATSSQPGSAVNEFKTMVRELHRNGIEVILDVVFNHTAEGNETGPLLSFKGIESSIYYMHDNEGKLSNYTGCGNTFNCNHPIVRKLIIDCLHYWALEMHVDGFRFDLASILQRGINGAPLEYSPLVEEITEDPLLANIKLIAEPWDVGGLYQVGRFVPQKNHLEKSWLY